MRPQIVVNICPTTHIRWPHTATDQRQRYHYQSVYIVASSNPQMRCCGRAYYHHLPVVVLPSPVQSLVVTGHT